MSLKSLAKKRNILIGTAVSGNALRNNADYRNLIVQEFNLITPENAMKWEVFSPKRNTFAFDDADLIVDFARNNNQKVHGHTLVWDKQIPDWLKRGNFSKKEFHTILEKYINRVVDRFKGKIIAWDVINEALGDCNDDYDGDSFWYKNLGIDYIETAFNLAHSTDKNALLFYNDWGIEDINVYKMLENLLIKGVPVHGVGFQMHIGPNFSPNIKNMRDNIDRFSDLGLKVWITEMDVRITDSRCTKEEFEIKQPEIYKAILSAIVEQGKVDAITFWGLDDSHSWITYSLDKNDSPLLFDKDLKPKSAYYAVADALR